VRPKPVVLRGTWLNGISDEAEAMVTLEDRLQRAPMASLDMLRKVFGAFEDDEEMRLVMFALGPLYAEGKYDPDKGVASNRKTIYNAETHSESTSSRE
jgi:proline iminopeptidase